MLTNVNYTYCGDCFKIYTNIESLCCTLETIWVNHISIKKIVTTPNLWGFRKTGLLTHSWWDCKMGQLLWKTTCLFFKRWNIQLPCTLAIVLLGIYLREWRHKHHAYTNICTRMHRAIYNSQHCKQLKCPSTVWLVKVKHIHAIKYYSAIKRNML